MSPGWPVRSELGNQELKSSVREGGRIKRQHHPPRTPLQRLLTVGGSGEQGKGQGPAGAVAEQRSDGPAGDDPPLPGAAGLAGQR